MSGQAVKIGIVGCGNISGIYFQNAAKLQDIEVAACADLDLERARAAAQEHGVAKACSTEELLADPEIRIVVNLTVPQAHFEVAMAAVQAGKSVYNEKPLTLAREDAAQLLEAAEARGVLVGGAPDTFMGAGIQTCRKLIDDGWLGDIVSADAFMMCPGHESWHPSPEFYYQKGGGPMFDMGPYYLTALVNLVGPVRRVAGMARRSFATRTITSAPKFGKVVEVQVPTHVAGLMEFASGAVGTMITSFDTIASTLPRIEVHGSRASLQVPDPNTFGGPVRIRPAASKEWQDVPMPFGYGENSRGLGVADMACALASGRPHRASGALTSHVLDIMHAFHDASEKGGHVELGTDCERPAPLPLGLRAGSLDA